MICKANERKIEKRQNMRGGNNSVQVENLFAPFSSCRLSAILTLEKGASIGEHEHLGEAELFYMLSGAAIYTDNGVPVMLGAGDSALVHNGHHGIEGISDEPCRILAIIAND